MTNIRPRRSVLYMPGSNARALEKAKSLPADALILDLEDAVAPDTKEEARERVCAAVRDGGYGNREIAIRVNALESDWGADDLAAAAQTGASAVCVPKVSTPEDVVAVREGLASNGAPKTLAIWAMMETPLAILNAHEIVKASVADQHPVTVLVMGTNDLAKETRAELGGERAGMLVWLSRCVIAARAYGLDILDGVYNDFRDTEGLEREAVQGRMLGMDGKTLIHPGQIAVANEIFSPPAEDVAWARTVIAAFESEDNQGKGVITIDGKMVELLHRDMALRTVAIADAIANASAS